MRRKKYVCIFRAQAMLPHNFICKFCWMKRRQSHLCTATPKYRSLVWCYFIAIYFHFSPSFAEIKYILNKSDKFAWKHSLLDGKSEFGRPATLILSPLTYTFAENSNFWWTKVFHPWSDKFCSVPCQKIDGVFQSDGFVSVEIILVL